MASIDTPNQLLGRAQTIGCVAVEITQKCNLDCSLCYLSEHSESVKDLPLEEVYRRLDAVVEHYGRGVHVQITGGDPTLRKHTELLKIIAYASDIGLYPALFTNGIGATRKLLTRLAEAGLSDIAFHVDSSQQRPGYTDELSLHPLRLEYLARARGLGLTVMFNNTLHSGNFHQLADLIGFYVEQAAEVGLVSFNLQAETGRGEWRGRDDIISQQSVRAKLEQAAGRPLPWDVVRLGHADCHSYMPTLVVNKRVHPFIDDAELFAGFIADFHSLDDLRHLSPLAILSRYGAQLLSKPRWWAPALGYVLRQLWRCGGDLVAARGRAHKLTFFIQNFMDAEKLDQGRVDACSFMVMSADGPVSMCQHNAARDDYILKPLDVRKADGSVEHYEPLIWKKQSA